MSPRSSRFLSDAMLRYLYWIEAALLLLALLDGVV